MTVPLSPDPVGVTEIPADVLCRVSRFVSDRLGLNFPPDRNRDLVRGLRNAAREAGHTDISAYVQWLLETPLTKPQVEDLAGHLTIGETYFYRHKEQFRFLEERVVPELTRARREQGDLRLRIWCAGCSTGEEPYSVAIALTRCLPDLPQWKVTILATDINRKFLRQAEAGIYTDWSFRDAPPWLREGFFHRVDERRVRINHKIREMVSFEHLNLAEDPYPSLVNNTSAMDIVFCRNVLIYFAPEHAHRVVSGFHRALREDGWLMVGPTDLMCLRDSEFGQGDPGCLNSHRKHALSPAPPLTPLLPPLSWAPPAIEKAAARPLPAAPVARSPLPAAPVRRETPYDHAVRQYAAGQYAAAMETLQEILRSKPGPDCSGGKCLALMARCHANQGALREAREWCLRAIAEDKVNPVHHYLKATIELELGEAAQAHEELRRTLFLDQDFVVAHFTMGNLLRAQARTGEARKHFGNVLELLKQKPRDALVPESDGLTAGRLSELAAALVVETG